MVPASFVFLDRLPMLSSAKVDRAALPAPGTGRPSLAEPFVAPRDDSERRLAAIWSEVLGLDDIGIRDSFFELGGHSILAAQLFAAIEKAFGSRLPLHTLLRAPTVETMAAVLNMAPKASESSCLIEVQAGSGGQPFFCVPGAAVDVITFAPLAQALGVDQTFYGIQAVGLDGVQTPHTTVGEMADHYIAAIRSHQPEGPYMLGGSCFGGFVAFEMACRLHEQGRRVALLALMDSSQPPPMMTLFGHLAQLLTHHLPRGRLMYCLVRDVQEEFRKVFRKLSWRRQHRHLLRVWRAHAAARKGWTPKTYPGRVILFQSVESGVRFPEYRARWEALVGGGVDCHAIPGSHSGMLRDECLATVARQLRAYINQARASA
jgi:aspartate racemase